MFPNGEYSNNKCMSAPVIISTHTPFTNLDTSKYNARFNKPINIASKSTVVNGRLNIMIN